MYQDAETLFISSSMKEEKRWDANMMEYTGGGRNGVRRAPPRSYLSEVDMNVRRYWGVEFTSEYEDFRIPSSYQTYLDVETRN